MKRKEYEEPLKRLGEKGLNSIEIPLNDKRWAMFLIRGIGPGRIANIEEIPVSKVRRSLISVSVKAKEFLEKPGV